MITTGHMSKKAALQIQLTDEKVERIEKNQAKIQATSRADFAERAIDYVMPLIEAGEMVNLNGQLVMRKDLAKHLEPQAA